MSDLTKPHDGGVFESSDYGSMPIAAKLSTQGGSMAQAQSRGHRCNSCASVLVNRLGTLVVNSAPADQYTKRRLCENCADPSDVEMAQFAGFERGQTVWRDGKAWTFKGMEGPRMAFCSQRDGFSRCFPVEDLSARNPMPRLRVGSVELPDDLAAEGKRLQWEIEAERRIRDTPDRGLAPLKDIYIKGVDLRGDVADPFPESVYDRAMDAMLSTRPAQPIDISITVDDRVVEDMQRVSDALNRTVWDSLYKPEYTDAGKNPDWYSGALTAEQLKAYVDAIPRMDVAQAAADRKRAAGASGVLTAESLKEHSDIMRDAFGGYRPRPVAEVDKSMVDRMMASVDREHPDGCTDVTVIGFDGTTPVFTHRGETFELGNGIDPYLAPIVAERFQQRTSGLGGDFAYIEAGHSVAKVEGARPRILADDRDASAMGWVAGDIFSGGDGFRIVELEPVVTAGDWLKFNHWGDFDADTVLSAGGGVIALANGYEYSREHSTAYTPEVYRNGRWIDARWPE